MKRGGVEGLRLKVKASVVCDLDSLDSKSTLGSGPPKLDTWYSVALCLAKGDHDDKQKKFYRRF